MPGNVRSLQTRARAEAEELLRVLETSEAIIVSTIERECEALRAGRMLAANALRMRLRDAARLYLHAVRAARASLWTIEQILPGTRRRLEEQRSVFSALLRVELAVLAAERAAAGNGNPPARAEPDVRPAASGGAGARILSFESSALRSQKSGSRPRRKAG